MIVLVVIAAFGSVAVDRSLMLLLLMSTPLSAVLASFRREAPLAAVIDHRDEAIAYAALHCPLIAFRLHVPA